MPTNEQIAERLVEHERVEMLAIEAQNRKLQAVGTRVEQVYELGKDNRELLRETVEAIRRIERRLGTVEKNAALAKLNGDRPPSHDWGRRDTDYEVTSSGQHVRVEHETFAHMQRSLAEIEDERKINAAVVKKLKGWWKWAVAIGGAIGAIIHWISSGGLHHLLGP